MRTNGWLFVVVVSLFFGGVVVAQQSTGAAKPTPGATSISKSKPVAKSPFRIVATVKDLMDAMIDPAGDAIFDAVSTTVTPTSTEEKAPKNEDEWTTVRNNALI